MEAKIAHGLDGTLVAADWPALTLDEVRDGAGSGLTLERVGVFCALVLGILDALDVRSSGPASKSVDTLYAMGSALRWAEFELDSARMWDTIAAHWAGDYADISRTLPPAFASIESRRLTSTGTAAIAAISPDGRYIAYTIRDQTNPLAATVQAKAVAMDQAKLDFKMTLDPFSYRPTFHLALRLVGLDVTKVNDLALAYGKFDFKRGWFDVVLEADAKEGQLTGYVKPLFRDLKVFSLSQDIKEDNALQFLWQALVGAATTVFKNQPRNQFGTLIPFTGDATGTTKTAILATIGNILRNAFVRAYLPRLEGNQDVMDGMQFEAPEFDEHLATGGAD